MTEALALREQLVARHGGGRRQADGQRPAHEARRRRARRDTAPVNATFTGEEIHRHPAAHVGIAVAAPHGLVVPVDPRRRPAHACRRSPAPVPISSAAPATAS